MSRTKTHHYYIENMQLWHGYDEPILHMGTLARYSGYIKFDSGDVPHCDTPEEYACSLCESKLREMVGVGSIERGEEGVVTVDRVVEVMGDQWNRLWFSRPLGYVYRRPLCVPFHF